MYVLLGKAQGKEEDKEERAHVHAYAKVRVDKYGKPCAECAQGVVDGEVDAVGHVLGGETYAIYHSGEGCVDKDKTGSHEEDGDKESKGCVKEEKEHTADEDENAHSYGLHFAVQNFQDTL